MWGVLPPPPCTNLGPTAGAVASPGGQRAHEPCTHVDGSGLRAGTLWVHTAACSLDQLHVNLLPILRAGVWVHAEEVGSG